MTFSKNGIALTVLAIEFILSSLGIEFEVGSVEHTVEAVFVLASFILMVWNQIERKDTLGFLFKHG